MKLIEEFLKGSSDRTVKLLGLLISLNKYCAISEIRQTDHRNLIYVKKDMKTFMELNWVVSKEEASLIGKNKVPIFYTKYKINNEHPVIKMLNSEVQWEISQ